MEPFLPIAGGCDVQPVLDALERQPEWWNTLPVRKAFPGSPHAAVDDILLRFQPLVPVFLDQDIRLLVDEPGCINYPAFQALPAARKLVFALMQHVQGERLGRVMITRLLPGKRILPHIDQGGYADYYARFHIVLAGDAGMQFRTGADVVQMLPGECWWFDTSQEHEVWHEGTVPRLTLIVDVRTARGGRYV